MPLFFQPFPFHRGSSDETVNTSWTFLWAVGRIRWHDHGNEHVELRLPPAQVAFVTTRFSAEISCFPISSTEFTGTIAWSWTATGRD